MTFLPIKRFTGVLLVLSLLASCGESDAPQQAAQGRPAPQVEVAQVISKRITEWSEFTGRLEAPETVELRPRVSGYIDMVAYDEGAIVNQGDTLFLIDNRPYKAEVSRLEAQLVQAKSQQTLAKTDLDRAQRLIKTKAVSQEELDNRSAQYQQATANVASILASLDLAKLNRGFTRVDAPISGRVSRAMFTTGNYVTAGESVLTTLVSTENLYAYFDVDEQSYLSYIDMLSAAKAKGETVEQQPVAMKLANSTDYNFWGELDFVDNSINPATGTIRVRASFENADGYLIPGMFAHLKIASSPSFDGILIDEKAVGTNLTNKFVLVLDADNKVVYRPVVLGDKVGGMRLIKSGLSAGESIVVNGLQRVRPGVVVNPQVVDMASAEQLASIEHWQKKLDAQVKLAKLNTPDSTGI